MCNTFVTEHLPWKHLLVSAETQCHVVWYCGTQIIIAQVWATHLTESAKIPHYFCKSVALIFQQNPCPEYYAHSVDLLNLLDLYCLSKIDFSLSMYNEQSMYIISKHYLLHYKLCFQRTIYRIVCKSNPVCQAVATRTGLTRLRLRLSFRAILKIWLCILWYGSSLQGRSQISQSRKASTTGHKNLACLCMTIEECIGLNALWTHTTDTDSPTRYKRPNSNPQL